MFIASAVCALLIALFPCNASAAQMVGGEFRTAYSYDSGNILGNLGAAVASAGDVNADGVNDFILGANGSSPNGIFGAGSAFVYSGATGTLLHRFDGELPYYALGTSVAGAGDFDGDGYHDLIVGVPQASPGGLYGAVHNAGSVYVFSGQTGAVLHRFDGALAADSLGTSVAGAGDVNGDGIDDILIGATWATIGGTVRNGAVYVYSGGSGVLLYQIDGPSEYSRMGQTVAAAGDVNLDGYDDFIVGVSGGEVIGIPAAGYAQVYSGATGTLLWQFDGAQQEQHLGTSVASAGDVNRDGVPDFIFGAPGSYLSGFRYGEAFVYSGSSGALIHHFQGEAANGHLGEAVAGAGDVDGDGFHDLIVGAPNESDTGYSQTGSAYLYSGATGRQIQSFHGTRYWSFLGTAVAGVGDINGDSLAEVLVGLPGAYYSETEGEAFVYSLDPYLHASQRSLSISVGGQVDFQLNFPASASLQEYKILLSKTGSGPSIYGIAIPLTLDQMVMDTYLGNYPVSNHTGMSGTLSSSGLATASMTAPAGIPSSLLGRQIWIAAISNRVGQLPEFSSIVVPITFVL